MHHLLRWGKVKKLKSKIKEKILKAFILRTVEILFSKL